MKALGNEAEFPDAVAAVADAEDECGFATLVQRDRAMQDAVAVVNVECQLAVLRQRQVGGAGDGDVLDVFRLAREVKAVAVCAEVVNAAVVARRLVVKNHVAVAAHFAVGGKPPDGAVSVDAAVNPQGDAAGGKGGVGTGDEGLRAHLRPAVQRKPQPKA